MNKNQIQNILYQSRLILFALVFIPMLLAIVQYADGKLTTGFLAYKQDYISNAFWLGGFYVHVGTSIFCLIAGFTQFSGFIRREFPKIHRGVGKVYIFSILFINFPAGLILAVHANGGLSNRIAFTILALLWFTFTLKAWISIRNKNITEHYRFMVRSYALTFSAITLRLWKLVFIELTDWDEMFIYQVDAWLGFGLNILIAELYLLSKKSLSD